MNSVSIPTRNSTPADFASLEQKWSVYNAEYHDAMARMNEDDSPFDAVEQRARAQSDVKRLATGCGLLLLKPAHDAGMSRCVRADGECVQVRDKGILPPGWKPFG